MKISEPLSDSLFSHVLSYVHMYWHSLYIPLPIDLKQTVSTYIIQCCHRQIYRQTGREARTREESTDTWYGRGGRSITLRVVYTVVWRNSEVWWRSGLKTALWLAEKRVFFCIAPSYNFQTMGVFKPIITPDLTLVIKPRSFAKRQCKLLVDDPSHRKLKKNPFPFASTARNSKPYKTTW